MSTPRTLEDASAAFSKTLADLLSAFHILSTISPQLHMFSKDMIRGETTEERFYQEVEAHTLLTAKSLSVLQDLCIALESATHTARVQLAVIRTHIQKHQDAAAAEK